MFSFKITENCEHYCWKVEHVAANIAANIASNIARCGCLYFPQFLNMLVETVWMGQQHSCQQYCSQYC